MKGEWVPANELEKLNEERMAKDEPFLVMPYRPYEEDKDHLTTMRKQARNDFLYLRNQIFEYLKQSRKTRGVVEKYDRLRPPMEQRDELAAGLSEWFSDYLMDNGYYIDDSPTIMYKQMMMAAFPPITKDTTITTENVEQVAVNYAHVLNKYLDDKDLSGARKAFAKSVVTVDC